MHRQQEFSVTIFIHFQPLYIADEGGSPLYKIEICRKGKKCIKIFKKNEELT